MKTLICFIILCEACTEQEEDFEICATGECLGTMTIPDLQLAANGYYHQHI